MKPTIGLNDRTSGVVAHVTSLPGPHGCGDIGRSSTRFVDFLRKAGQSWWQILPLGPAGEGNSPYSTFSAFAASPILVSLERLFEDGLLSRHDLIPSPALDDRRVRYSATWRYRLARLRKAHAALRSARGGLQVHDYESYCQRESAWLDDFALFCALREAHGFLQWIHWDRDVRMRRVAALRSARLRLRDELDFHRFVQWTFSRQWSQLKAHASAAGVGIIGDVPIFVSHDSADVWVHRHLFLLDRDGRPRVVSGVPPDDFNRNGQLWGHPLYDWKAHHAERFGWWGARFREAARCFDAVRIDHFLGFHRLWATPSGARTARHGRWLPTPGAALLMAITSRLGGVPIIAEDLGHVTPEAFALRDRFRIQGMRVLQCGFGGDGEGSRYHQPHNYPRASVAYTGTHDFETTLGWYRGLRRPDRLRGQRDGLGPQERLTRYMGSSRCEDCWPLIRLVLSSAANTTLFPLQDLLSLDNGSRLNSPGKARGNWEWRVDRGALGPSLARRSADTGKAFER